MITLRLRTIDGLRRTKTFKTLAGARTFAHARVGEAPDVSMTFGYVVSADGVAKIEAPLATLRDVFPRSFEGD
jgi:hypothetical protein